MSGGNGKKSLDKPLRDRYSYGKNGT